MAVSEGSGHLCKGQKISGATGRDRSLSAALQKPDPQRRTRAGVSCRLGWACARPLLEALGVGYFYLSTPSGGGWGPCQGSRGRRRMTVGECHFGDVAVLPRSAFFCPCGRAAPADGGWLPHAARIGIGNFLSLNLHCLVAWRSPLIARTPPKEHKRAARQARTHPRIGHAHAP